MNNTDITEREMAINKFKNKQRKKYRKLPECSICLTKVGKKTKKKTKCDHIFHHYCLDKWLLISDSCPMCREVLKTTEVFFFFKR